MQADLRLCWSHIPHCWESHELAQTTYVILGILSISFRDMEIQWFLKFGDICHISFRDKGYFSKYLKGYGILGPPPPLPGPLLWHLLEVQPTCSGDSKSFIYYGLKVR